MKMNSGVTGISARISRLGKVRGTGFVRDIFEERGRRQRRCMRLNMRAKRNHRRTIGLLGNSREATALNESPRPAQVSPFFQSASPFATSLQWLTKMFLARYEESAKYAVNIHKDVFQKRVLCWCRVVGSLNSLKETMSLSP